MSFCLLREKLRNVILVIILTTAGYLSGCYHVCLRGTEMVHGDTNEGGSDRLHDFSGISRFVLVRAQPYRHISSYSSRPKLK
ncbi:hypothetical protein Agabi119p4_9682 [Agaricus bisporus var. burnettii]|uniref:Uncharacterized protein n=1 Tax=Agaricus bisporus var. burnettii TaxID=192524 RepID=A0A8H7C438_AGABI|nr:hypothetical protein Agabi119p4_9682 [Agaricus bisporus var. burnettii]